MLSGEGQRAQPSGTRDAERLGRTRGERARGRTRVPVPGHSPALMGIQDSDDSDDSDSSDSSSCGQAEEAAPAMLGLLRERAGPRGRSERPPRSAGVCRLCPRGAAAAGRS